MADFASLGVAQGIAQGLNQGVGNYLQARQQNIENQRLQQQQDRLNQQGLLQNAAAKAQLQEKGYDIDPASGGLIKTQFGKDYEDPNSDVSKGRVAEAQGLLQKSHPDIAQGLLGKSAKELDQMGYGKDLVGKIVTEDIANQKTNQMMQMYGLKQGTAQDKQTDKQFKDFTDSINPDKGRAGNLAQYKQSMVQADKIKGLVDRTDYNLTPSETTELAAAYSRMVKGGQVDVHSMEGLMPKSFVGDANKVVSWFLNKPKGLEQQEFVKRLIAGAERERDVSEAALKNSQYAQAMSNLKLKDKDESRFNDALYSQGLNPDEFDKFQQLRKQGKAILPKYADQDQQAAQAPAAANAPATGLINQGAPAMSPQDQQAIQWARSNPSDPRAAKILSLHGLK